MGLDMYLKAKVYLSYNDEARQKISKLIGHAEFEVTHVELEVGYWRKANAIHKWFVDHVQNGQDDCGQHFVADRHLEELYNVCNQVLADPSKASELLPTQSGFFFGSTEYSDWYMDDIRDTLAIISRALEMRKDPGVEIHYHSSW